MYQSVYDKYGVDLSQFQWAHSHYADGVDLDDTNTTPLWTDIEELDLEGVKLIATLLELGTAIDDIQAAFNGGENSDLETFKEALRSLGTTATATAAALQQATLLSEEFQKSFFATASQEDIGAYMKKYFGSGNVDWTNRVRVSAETMRQYWPDYNAGDYATKYGYGTTASVRSEEGAKEYKILVTPILPDGSVLSQAGIQAYVNEISQKASEMGLTLLEADAVENGGKGLLYYVSEMNGNLDAATAAAEAFDAALGNALDAYDSKSIATLAGGIADDIEAAKQALTGYKEVLDTMAGMESGEGMLNYFQSLSGDTQSGFVSEYKELAVALNELNAARDKYSSIAQRNTDTDAEAATKAAELAKAEEKVAEATAKVNSTLQSAKKINAMKYFKDTAKTLNELKTGTKSAAEASKTLLDVEEKVVDAQTEYQAASEKFAKETEVTAGEIKTLAEVLGWTPEALLGNWDMVDSLMSDMLAEYQGLRTEMQKEIYLNITGTSEADFSNVLNGLAVVQNSADAAVQALLATGQFEIDTEELTQTMEYPVLNGGMFDGVHYETLQAGSTVQVIKLKGAPGLKNTGGGSSGGGGGGGGGKKNKGPTEVEIMLDRMQQMQDLQNHSRSLYSAQASYYTQTGELQGVIRYYQKEIDLIGRQNQTLEENVAELDTWIQKKKAEVDSLKNGTEEYETAAKELKDLQQRHQEYSLALINNRTELDKLTEAIKQQNDAIRSMEIDLRETILKAIKDREALNERMLQGQITLENEILGLIQKRYEKERDLI